jgi:predicted deacylase
MNQKKSLLHYILFLILIVFSFKSMGQNEMRIINNLSEMAYSEPGIHNFWLEMGSNTFGYPMLIPIIVIQGQKDGPTLGLTAAIHGNELNGIAIIHKLVETIDVKLLKGRVVAIPGLNAVSVELDQRRFIDDEDLNRNFPGKETGNRSEQYAYKISKRVLPIFDFQIDMHTASFGRTNTMYARADASNDTIMALAKLQGADIILNSKGTPSFGNTSSSSRTMRAETGLKGNLGITVEYGNPQVYQSEIVNRGLQGIYNSLVYLNMYTGTVEESKFPTTYCKKSYWIYMDEGGFLEVMVELNQHLKKGDKMAVVKNAFGQVLKEYFAPEDGIVIGKSSNPVNMSGGRIIHLGILDNY